MRLTPLALSLAIVIGTMASAGYGQRVDDQVDPRSLALLEQGRAHFEAGRNDAAVDALETALAVDPSNRGAFVTLGRVSQAQKLPGKAIRFYMEALKLEPNDANALAGQGEALVQRGAVDRAEQNLTKLRAVCGDPCPQASALSRAIERGPPAEVLTAQRPEQGAPRDN